MAVIEAEKAKLPLHFPLKDHPLSQTLTQINTFALRPPVTQEHTISSYVEPVFPDDDDRCRRPHSTICWLELLKAQSPLIGHLSLTF